MIKPLVSIVCLVIRDTRCELGNYNESRTIDSGVNGSRRRSSISNELWDDVVSR